MPLDLEFADLSEVRQAYRRSGDGDRLVVLLHGWPQTGRCWRKVQGALGGEYTVVAPDLRGYGDSGLAHTGYDKRATAYDLHELIRYLGHSTAMVAGHDRGARVAHRWALDHPSDVNRLALLDILPTREVIPGLDLVSAKQHWHWLFHLQPGLPELLLAGNVRPYVSSFLAAAVQKGAIEDEVLAHYVRALEDPAHLSATLDDYRAGFTTDLDLDEADATAGRVIRSPLLVLWGAEGALHDADVLSVWRRYALNVLGEEVPGSGHYLAEEQPAAVAFKLGEFFAPQ